MKSKPNSTRNFRFQRFSIADDRCGMKVGTDGVLLGAWAGVERCQRILDIGTGCGLIALMLAQRTELDGCLIEALEIDPMASQQACENFQASPWCIRLLCHSQSLQDFAETERNRSQFDHLVSNPPFFERSMGSADPHQHLARHTTHLSRTDLFRCAANLLVATGRISLVLPFDQWPDTEKIAGEWGFHVWRVTSVRPLPGRSFKRVLLEFGQSPSELISDELTIEQTRHVFSSEYENLTRKFHLRFAGGAGDQCEA